jgi:hypothetical protein
MYVQDDLLILDAYEHSDSSLLLSGALSSSFDSNGSVDDSAGFEMIYDTNRKFKPAGRKSSHSSNWGFK